MSTNVWFPVCAHAWICVHLKDNKITGGILILFVGFLLGILFMATTNPLYKVRAEDMILKT